MQTLAMSIVAYFVLLWIECIQRLNIMDAILMPLYGNCCGWW